MKSSQVRPINRIVQCMLGAAAIGCMALVLSQNQETIREISRRHLDLRFLASAFLITQVSLLITLVRWSVLVRAIEPGFTFRYAIFLGLVGYLFNLMIPGAVGGDVVKAAYLSRMRVKRTQVIASMAVDRIVGLLGLLILAGAAGVIAWNIATREVRALIGAAWCALSLGTVAVVVLSCPSIVRDKREPGGRLSNFKAEIRAASLTYRHRPGVLLTSLGLSLISHGLNVVAFFLIGKMLFGARMPTTLAQHFLMAPLTFFSMAAPLPFAAVGLTEEVGGQLFHLVGHPGGAVTMFGLRLMMLACGLECACVCLCNLALRAGHPRSQFNDTGTVVQDFGSVTCGSQTR